MVALHENDLETVSLHDRPTGSSLGRYRCVIEVENEEGSRDEQIEAVCAMDGVRFAGCFDAAEKGNTAGTEDTAETENVAEMETTAETGNGRCTQRPMKREGFWPVDAEDRKT